MAIIIDPDSLDRDQVVFGTTSQKISLYPVGNKRHSSANGSNGVTTNGTRTFSASGATFTTWSVAAGDILVLKNKTDAGHYVISSVDSQTQLTVSSTHSTFTGDTSAVWEVRLSSGGSIEDGVSLQALYSFTKEEWRADSANVGGDDLIRYEFPFEAITSEQFEIGGGSSHKDWEWFNDYSRKKVRTGGFAHIDNASTTQNEWTGVVTLGSLDSDTQVYYQQTNSTTAPANFSFLGPVNEPVLTYTNGGANNRSYLKLFARKKGKTYAQSSISDIGVSTIRTIVNRFPLSHATDASITASDAAIIGSAPFRNQNTVLTGSNGAIANVNGTTGTLTSSGANFITNGVVVGDTLYMREGTFNGKYFTITAVDSETQLTVNTAEEGPFSSASSLDFTVYTTILIATKSSGTASDKTDGVLANVDGVTGTLTSSGSNFSTVNANDLVMITESGSAYRGIYKVISRDSNTQLTVDTTDKAFTSQSSIDFRVVKPGMYLQYKSESISIGSTGNITFAENDPSADTITRASGSWISDGVTAGSVLTFTGTTNNNKSFTVASRTATVVTLVATDDVVAEVASGATVTAFDGFKRTIGGVVYPFRWKVLGNNTTLLNIYQFIQHQLRQPTDIDYGPGVNRGDVTDALMTYSTPTGTTLDLYIDNLITSDVNNATYKDSTSTNRNSPFVAAGTLNFNANLTSDSNAKYWLFFSDVSGATFGTSSAIIVKDASGTDIAGTVSGNSSIAFTFDYDNNVQGSRTPGTNANVTLVAIGLNTAQYVIATGTITRSTSVSISAVANLERNYSNP